MVIEQALHRCTPLFDDLRLAPHHRNAGPEAQRHGRGKRIAERAAESYCLGTQHAGAVREAGKPSREAAYHASAHARVVTAVTQAVRTMLVDIVEVYSFLGMAESGAVIAQPE